MNKQHKQSEAIQAMIDLKLVDFLNPAGNLWKTWEPGDVTPFDCPYWQWRVKPESKPDTVFFQQVSLHADGSTFVSGLSRCRGVTNNLKLTFSSETGRLIKAEVIS